MDVNKLDENRSVGYQCGRLLAVLEDVGKNRIDHRTRCANYLSASKRPADIFGRLIKEASGDFQEIEIFNGPKMVFYYAELIDKIITRIGDEFPKVLVGEEELFALGYYQQQTINHECEIGKMRRVKCSD